METHMHKCQPRDWVFRLKPSIAIHFLNPVVTETFRIGCASTSLFTLDGGAKGKG